MSIGVYDSGIGGLTVYRAIANRLKNVDLIYFGDSARVPYGNRSYETITRYSIECGKNLASMYPISALVVACNTISSCALPALNKALGIPILGVIDPGSRHAASVTKNNKIGVLGTHATIDSLAYVKAIKNICPNAEVFQEACPLFVPIVEEGLLEGEIALTVVRETLKNIANTGIDTLILACTHYPLLEPLISRVLPDVKIVDSTEYIIKDIEGLNINLNEHGERKILITDKSRAFNRLKTMLVGNVPAEVIKPI